MKPEPFTHDCQRCRDEASDYVDGLLSEQARNGLASHLSSCRACEGFVQGLRATISLLSELREDSLPMKAECEALHYFNEYYPEPEVANGIADWTAAKQSWGEFAGMSTRARRKRPGGGRKLLSPLLCDWLTSRAWRVNPIRPDQAVLIAQTAVGIARHRNAEYGDLRRLLRALDALACCLLTARHYPPLEGVFGELRQLCEAEETHEEEKARFWATYGLYLSYTGRFEEAKGYLSQALDYTRGVGNRRKLVSQLVNFAGALIAPGEGAGALDYCREADALLDPEQDPPSLQLSLYCNYVLALCEAGLASDARRLVPKVARLTPAVGGWYQRTYTYWLEGTVSRAEGRYSKAEEIFEAVRSEFLSRGHLVWYVEASLDLSRVYMKQGRLDALHELVSELLQKCSELGADRLVRSSVTAFAEVVKQRTLSEQALRSLAIALGSSRLSLRF